MVFWKKITYLEGLLETWFLYDQKDVTHCNFDHRDSDIVVSVVDRTYIAFRMWLDTAKYT